MVVWTKVWETQVEGIDDIYIIHAQSKKSGELNNVGDIATPITNDYLWTKHVNHDKLILHLLHRNDHKQYTKHMGMKGGPTIWTLMGGE
jgi:hypothetical protein